LHPDGGRQPRPLASRALGKGFEAEVERSVEAVSDVNDLESSPVVLDGGAEPVGTAKLVAVSADPRSLVALARAAGHRLLHPAVYAEAYVRPSIAVRSARAGGVRAPW
jgi:hypothetical protein